MNLIQSIEEFNTKYINYTRDNYISDNKLSEDALEYYINNYIGYVDWFIILEYQTLSESLIEKYSNEVNWCM